MGRLTKIRQMLLRQRKMAKTEKTTELVGVKKKTERREATREAKAEKAAQVELAIERELLQRLRQGTYGQLYNYDSVSNKLADSNENVDSNTAAQSVTETEFANAVGEERFNRVLDQLQDEEELNLEDEDCDEGLEDEREVNTWRVKVWLML